MSIISVNNLTFSYEGNYDNIFENASFQIDSDWKLGLIGRNGRGKTTLLKLLMGEYQYKGKILSSENFEYFPFPLKSIDRKVIDVLKDTDIAFEEWEIIRELAQLGMPADALERNFMSLSKGEQTKVQLALLFLKKHTFLLIDEPTNHLDAKARELVSEYLNTKKGFILVSHDRAFLDKCVDHILSINKADIQVQSGNFTSWWENKQRQDKYETAQNQRLAKEIKRLKAASEKTSRWSDRTEKTKYGDGHVDKGFIGHKAAKLMKRSKSIEQRRAKALEEKSMLLKNMESSEELKLHQLDYIKDRLVTLDNVSIFYDDNCILKNISFSITKNQRIAVCGRNGSGKSSILKLVLGERMKHSGTVNKGSGLVISYVPQDTSHLAGGLSEYALNCGIDESLFRAILRKLDFSRIQFDKDMSDFSEGQKKKVLIARSLCERAHLYVWDEPLNYIDIISRMQIEELITNFEPTLVFVEHDSAFVNSVATDVINLDAAIG